MFGRLDGFPKVGASPNHGRVPLVEEDDVAVGADDLSMVRKIVVDLADDIMCTSVDPTSCDQESDTDVQALPTLEKVAADVAVEEISALLWEVLSTHPQRVWTPRAAG